MKRPPSFFLKKQYGIDPWLDLVNSQEWDGFGRPTDYLQDPDWQSFFLRQWRFRPARPAAPPLAELRELRTVLRRMVLGFARNRRPAAADVAVVNRMMNVAGREKLIQHHNGFRSAFLPVRDDWSWVVSRIASSFAAVLVAGRSRQVKVCANDGCSWVFLDRTKGNTRRWCDDKTCGNRARVRRSRAAKRKNDA